jgi:hypothetical protein
MEEFESIKKICNTIKKKTKSPDILEALELIREICKKSIQAKHTITDTHVNTITEKLSTLKNDISEIKKALEQNTQTNAHLQLTRTQSYANALTKKKDTLHTIIIANTDEKEKSSTINLFKDNIKPTEMKIGIAAMKQTTSGKLIVKCTKEKDAQKIKEAIQKTKNQQVITTTRKPKLILKGVPKDIPQEDILEMLTIQNDNFQEDEDTKIVTETKNKNENLKNVIIETNKTTHALALVEERLNLGYSRVKVEDVSPLTQCYKCQGFGHTTKYCKAEKDTCQYCAGAHKGTECSKKKPEDLKCANCLKSPTHKSKTGHCANDRKCPIRARFETYAQERLN